MDEAAAVEALDELLGRSRPRHRRAAPLPVPPPLVRRAVYDGAPGGWRLGRARALRAALAERGASASARAHHVEHAARHGDTPRSRSPRGRAGGRAARPRERRALVRRRVAPAAPQRAAPAAGRAAARAREAAGATGRLEESRADLLESLGARAGRGDRHAGPAHGRVRRRRAHARPPQESHAPHHGGAGGAPGRRRARGRRADDGARVRRPLPRGLRLRCATRPRARCEVARPLGDRPLTATAAAGSPSPARGAAIAEAERHRAGGGRARRRDARRRARRRLDAAAYLAAAESTSTATRRRSRMPSERWRSAARPGRQFPMLVPTLATAYLVRGKLGRGDRGGRRRRRGRAARRQRARTSPGGCTSGPPRPWRPATSTPRSPPREEAVELTARAGGGELPHGVPGPGPRRRVAPGRGSRRRRRGPHRLGRRRGAAADPGGWRARATSCSPAVSWRSAAATTPRGRGLAAATAADAASPWRPRGPSAPRPPLRSTRGPPRSPPSARSPRPSRPRPPAPSSRPRRHGRSRAGRSRRPATTPAPRASSGARPTAFEACGAACYRDEAERELRKLGHRIHRRTRPGTAGGRGLETLTERELEVARLVVARRTNAEIAAELFLSPRRSRPTCATCSTSSASPRGSRWRAWWNAPSGSSLGQAAPLEAPVPFRLRASSVKGGKAGAMPSSAVSP